MSYISIKGNLAQNAVKNDVNGKQVLSVPVIENYSRKNQQTGQYDQVGSQAYQVTLWNAQGIDETVLTKGRQVVVHGKHEVQFTTGRNGEKYINHNITAKGIGITPFHAKQQAVPAAQPIGQQQTFGNTQGQDPWSQPVGTSTLPF